MDIKSAYDIAAVEYRKKYENIPARVDDIEQTLGFVNKPNSSVIEIGCAYGREASYIVTKTNQYLGIDICEQYIEMAKNEVPEGKFKCIDVMDFDWPSDTDVVFAFASLLHNSKEDVALLLERISNALNVGGVLFISLKRKEAYSTALETDDVVSRRFYYYTRETINNIKPSELTEVYYNEQSRQVDWFTMILQKQ